MRYLITCRSLTYAQRSARLLEHSGITAGVSKAPAGLSRNGCSYCLTVSEAKLKAAAELLRREDMLQGRIYSQDKDGITKEVFL